MAVVVTEDRLTDFRASFLGPVLVPGDDGYEEARWAWSGMFDRRPSVIARCMGVADVQASIAFARANDLQIAVRGGGHSISGASTIEHGILIDLGLMHGVRVDPENRTAVVAAGTLWSEFDRETQVHSLGCTGGMISHTGVAGLTLGGGVGRFMRKVGLTCDNVLGCDVVTADGEWLHVDADNHSDLYWALRGGGGDFGIVTHFEFALHPLGPTVFGGHLAWPLDQAKELFSKLRTEIDNAPEELQLQFLLITAMDPAYIPPQLPQEGGIVLLTTTWMGQDLGAGERAYEPFRKRVPPALDLLAEVPYAPLQAANDGFATPGRRTYSKTGFFDDLSDDFIDVCVAHCETLPKPMGIFELYQMGGAVKRMPPEETPAYPFRDTEWFYVVGSNWFEKAEDEQWINWSREGDAKLRQFSRPGWYMNFVAEEDDENVLDALGDQTFQRLAEIKAKYDPDGVFNRNPNKATAAIPV